MEGFFLDFLAVFLDCFGLLTKPNGTWPFVATAAVTIPSKQPSTN
jgi:hypothetical protein